MASFRAMIVSKYLPVAMRFFVTRVVKRKDKIQAVVIARCATERHPKPSVGVMYEILVAIIAATIIGRSAKQKISKEEGNINTEEEIRGLLRKSKNLLGRNTYVLPLHGKATSGPSSTSGYKP